MQNKGIYKLSLPMQDLDKFDAFVNDFSSKMDAIMLGTQTPEDQAKDNLLEQTAIKQRITDSIALIKQQGNADFSNNQYESAIESYTQAIDITDSPSLATQSPTFKLAYPTENLEFVAARIEKYAFVLMKDPALHLNRGFTYQKLKQLDLALMNYAECLRCLGDESDVKSKRIRLKCLWRRSEVRKEMKDYVGRLADLSALVELNRELQLQDWSLMRAQIVIAEAFVADSGKEKSEAIAFRQSNKAALIIARDFNDTARIAYLISICKDDLANRVLIVERLSAIIKAAPELIPITVTFADLLALCFDFLDSLNSLNYFYSLTTLIDRRNLVRLISSNSDKCMYILHDLARTIVYIFQYYPLTPQSVEFNTQTAIVYLDKMLAATQGKEVTGQELMIASRMITVECVDMRSVEQVALYAERLVLMLPIQSLDLEESEFYESICFLKKLVPYITRPLANFKSLVERLLEILNGDSEGSEDIEGSDDNRWVNSCVLDLFESFFKLQTREIAPAVDLIPYAKLIGVFEKGWEPPASFAFLWNLWLLKNEQNQHDAQLALRKELPRVWKMLHKTRCDGEVVARFSNITHHYLKRGGLSCIVEFNDAGMIETLCLILRESKSLAVQKDLSIVLSTIAKDHEPSKVILRQMQVIELMYNLGPKILQSHK